MCWHLLLGNPCWRMSLGFHTGGDLLLWGASVSRFRPASSRPTLGADDVTSISCQTQQCVGNSKSGEGVYIAQYPVCWTAQSTLHFTHWQIGSFWLERGFSGKRSSHTTITRNKTHFHHCLYNSLVLIYTAEWTGTTWREWKWPNFESEANGIRTRVPSIVSPAFSGLEICSNNGSKCYHVLSFATRMLKW